MDKHDRELVDFCLQHNVKSLDEAEFALAKLKAEEPMRIENEQKEQARVHAEDIEKIEHAVEVRRSELLSRMFAYAQHDRDRAVVTINGKQVGYDTNIKGYPCPFCKSRLERRDLEWTLEIATGAFPDLLRKSSDSIRTITEMGTLTTWQGKVRCPTCKKQQLAVMVQSR